VEVEMIDIPKLARDSGASLEEGHEWDWWEFSPDELSLFSEKVMQAAQAAEREQAKELVEALKEIADQKSIRGEFMSDASIARAAIAKYEESK
jgi:hypothetical protein